MSSQVHQLNEASEQCVSEEYTEFMQFKRYQIRHSENSHFYPNNTFYNKKMEARSQMVLDIWI